MAMGRIVMGVDPAAGFGYAFYDLEKPPSAIVSGALKLDGDAIDKIRQMRLELAPLIRRYGPTFAAIEAPFAFAPRYKKKPKKDLLTPVLGDQAPPQPADEFTMNPKTISHAGKMFGAAAGILMSWNVRCIEVEPRTWQTIIPDTIKAGTKDTKLRARQACEALRIVATNIDSRDAALIAVWCAGHAQELKLIEMAAEK